MNWLIFKYKMMVLGICDCAIVTNLKYVKDPIRIREGKALLRENNLTRGVLLAYRLAFDIRKCIKND